MKTQQEEVPPRLGESWKGIAELGFEALVEGIQRRKGTEGRE